MSHLRTYANGWFASKKTEINALIGRYTADDTMTPQQLLDLLDPIQGRRGGRLSQIKSLIGNTINTSFLFNPDKAAVIQQLGEQLLAGQYQHRRAFLDIARAYRTETETAVWQLCDESMRLIDQSDSPSAMVFRALLHQFGLGGEQNYPAAIALLERAIELGHAGAMTSRAVMYNSGQGSEQNYTAAIALVEQAIAHGEARAMCNRAIMHQFGEGGAQNYPAAIALFEQAIPLGNSNAMYHRAYMHYFGQGGARNYPAAIALFEQAIALGHAGAMFNRAVMYQLGQGGAQNHPAANALNEQAITLGNEGAMFNRALMHISALGGPRNYPAAIALLEQAIALGLADAMNRRAIMHERGQGGDRDLAEAFRLYQLAAQKGHRGAQERLQSADFAEYSRTMPLPVVDSGDRDRGFVNQVFHDLTGHTCNAISGNRNNFNIEIEIPKTRLAEVTTRLVLSGAALQTKGSVTGNKIVMLISNLSYDQLASLRQPVNDLTEHDLHDAISANTSVPANLSNLRGLSIFRPELEVEEPISNCKTHHDDSETGSPRLRG